MDSPRQKIKLTKLKTYKYELLEDVTIYLKVHTTLFDVVHKYFELTPVVIHGQPYMKMTVRAGYKYDGPSGPTHDDETNIGPSLPHDVGYQAIRCGLLPYKFKDDFDDDLHDRCLACGMNAVRADYYHEGVRIFGGASCVMKAEGEEQDRIFEVCI